MASPVIQNNFRARKSFAKIGKIIDIPNLIDIQKQSYEKFLQKDIAFEKRDEFSSASVQRSISSSVTPVWVGSKSACRFPKARLMQAFYPSSDLG